jgi:hypothetical protein
MCRHKTRTYLRIEPHGLDCLQGILLDVIQIGEPLRCRPAGAKSYGTYSTSKSDIRHYNGPIRLPIVWVTMLESFDPEEATDFLQETDY